jgi:hypothetical protein
LGRLHSPSGGSALRAQVRLCPCLTCNLEPYRRETIFGPAQFISVSGRSA